MVSDTVNTILSAEKKAEEKLKLSKKDAEQIIANAKVKAERIKEEAKSMAEKQAAKLRQEYKATLKGIEDNSEKEFRKSFSEIKLQSGKKLEEAMELVINKLVS